MSESSFNVSTTPNLLMLLFAIFGNTTHYPRDHDTTSPFINITTTETATEDDTTYSSLIDVALDIIDESTLILIETVVNAGILPVLVLCGVTGNVINMGVFVRQGLGDRINLCLFSLAVCDTGFITLHMASRTFVIFKLFDKQLGAYWQIHSLPLTGVYLGFLLTSDTLTLIIALQRCIVVVSPLSATRMPNSKVMAAINLSIFAACFLGTFGYSIRWIPVTITDPVTNVTLEVVMDTEHYVQNLRLFLAMDMLFSTIVPVTLLVGVAILNVTIAVRMRSVLAWRKITSHAGSAQTTLSSASSTSANQREAAMTKTLVVLCGVYCICATPSAAQGVARFVVPELAANGRYRNTFYAGLCISHLLDTVNCSANFLIYFTMSSKFNETFRELFCKGKNGKQKRTETILITERRITHISSLGP